MFEVLVRGRSRLTAKLSSVSLNFSVAIPIFTCEIYSKYVMLLETRISYAIFYRSVKARARSAGNIYLHFS
jgi:hypothetical protein